MTLTAQLKAHSHKTHDSVDELVMSQKPFDSLDNYKKFLQAQYEFHKALQPIYQNQQLATQFSDLSALSRLEKVQNDMQALGVVPADNVPLVPDYSDDEAIGWLYCVEGSNIGAAILYKEAGKIELNDNHGAAHLAAHPDGRKAHWNDVKAKIDALPLDDTAKNAAKKGADDAFAYYKKLITAVYA